MSNFTDMVVLVAGGTGGLGLPVSLAFVEAGAKVAVTYRNPAEFAALRSEAGTRASSLEGYAVDLTDEAAVRKVVEEMIARHGRLDAMVNTVGGYAGGMKLWDLETKTFETMLALNLRAGYALARAAMAPMLKQRAGAIVNV